jgi:hypothetical protein
LKQPSTENALKIFFCTVKMLGDIRYYIPHPKSWGIIPLSPPVVSAHENRNSTTAYKASTKGASERFHRTLNSMLGKVVDEHQRDWCEYLPQIMAAYRSAKHEATGLPPNFLVYGRELSAPIDLVLGRPEGPQYHSVDDFVEQKLSIIETAHQMARENHAASSRSKRCYDAHVKEKTFKPNMWVWYYSPRKFVGR